MTELLTTEAARAVGVHADTLRRYERRGLIPKARRHKIAGWRVYSLEEVAAIRRIVFGEAAARRENGGGDA